MARTFIGLGSNLGSRRYNILSAWKALTGESTNQEVDISSPYLSEPVGMESNNWFINAVGIMNTGLTPERLLVEMLAIEKKLGRERSLGHDRPIDLDLLYYDNLILNDRNLIIPHPALANRLFVLEPLSELAPDHRHPVSHLTSRELLSKSGAEDSVKKISWDWK